MSSGEPDDWPGYIDINVTAGFWGGITFGWIATSSETEFYVGGGLVTPGVSGSITYSPSDPTPGWAVGLSGAAVVAGQVGYSFGEGGGSFWELGIGGGYPTLFGGSATVYYLTDGDK